MKSRLAKWLIGLPPLAYLLIFFAIPTLIMVFASFRYPGDYGGLAPFWENQCDMQVNGSEKCQMVVHFHGSNWRDFLTIDTYRRFFSEALWIGNFLKSIGYAATTAFICLLLAYPLAWTIARSGKKWAQLLVLLVILPFWSNFLVRVYAWMIVLGPQSGLSKAVNTVFAWVGLGHVELLHNCFAVIVVLVYVHLPFMVLPLYANLEKHDASLLDAAQDLGANAWQRFWRITFPLSLPGVYAGAALVFIPALGLFAVPELVGGPNDTLIGNLIKDQFRDARDWPFGSMLSLMLTLIALSMAGAAAWYSRRQRESEYA